MATPAPTTTPTVTSTPGGYYLSLSCPISIESTPTPTETPTSTTTLTPTETSTETSTPTESEPIITITPTNTPVQINVYLNNDISSVCTGLSFNSVYVTSGSYPITTGVIIYQDAACTIPLDTTPYSYITDQSISYNNVYDFNNLTGQVGSLVGSCI